MMATPLPGTVYGVILNLRDDQGRSLGLVPNPATQQLTGRHSRTILLQRPRDAFPGSCIRGAMARKPE
jgi:hypothetical protein